MRGHVSHWKLALLEAGAAIFAFVVVVTIKGWLGY